MIDLPVPIVLASSSGTRRELLARLVGEFDVLAPQVEERPPGGRPARREASALTLELAERKARAAARRRPDALVIGADTLVVCGGEVIGKPADDEDAVRILVRLSHRPHRVFTGVFVLAPDGRAASGCVTARVRMRPMSPERARDYVARSDALSRAGAYALGPDDPNLERVEGSMTAVMGLPLDELSAMLRDLYPAGGR